MKVAPHWVWMVAYPSADGNALRLAPSTQSGDRRITLHNSVDEWCREAHVHTDEQVSVCWKSLYGRGYRILKVQLKPVKA